MAHPGVTKGEFNHVYNNLDSGTKAVSTYLLYWEICRPLIDHCRQKWEEISKEKKRVKKDDKKAQGLESEVKEVERTSVTIKTTK